jgi:hypothetical protein
MNKVRNSLVVILFCVVGQCYAAPIEIDTIDNWQIYKGKQLLGKGNAFVEFSAVIKKEDLQDLAVRYHHCSHYSDIKVRLEISDINGSVLWSKDFQIDSGDRITIDRSAFEKLTVSLVEIGYQELKTNGINVILGTLKIE